MILSTIVFVLFSKIKCDAKLIFRCALYWQLKSEAGKLKSFLGCMC